MKVVTPLMTKDILADLWSRRLNTLTSGIANDDPYYLQIANAAEHISAEHQGRFLIELIQNANDQAVRHGLTNSHVSINRTASLIAVGNSGQPFDQGKVDSITSIFKSDKTADVCIGNKGIGFKAVFQIADSAEIFSSKPGGDLSNGCEIAFRMVRRPFEDPGFVAEISDLTNTLLMRDSERRHTIETRFPNEEALDVVIREAGRAAGFTFPLRLSAEDFVQRIKQLDLTSQILSSTQTLVVLPVNVTEKSFKTINEAIDEICGDQGQAGSLPPAASFLFLPGIGSIDVVDRVRGFHTELVRSETQPREALSDGVVLSHQRTTRTSRRIVLDIPEASEDKASQDWWVAERMVGGWDQQDEEKGKHERQALRDAIQALRLPEENWCDVEQIPVAVSLPIPPYQDGGDYAGHPLGANGRFCLGLPSQVQTGVPLWVSSHFHGKIDRTAIDFRNDYNALLLNAAVGLSETLIERLKTRSDETDTRLVTLAMERRTGELATAFFGQDGLAQKAVVLAADGSFIEARRLRMPKASDLSMFNLLVDGVLKIETYGFSLPDSMLLANARAILDGLAEGTEASDMCYLQRPKGLPSLLEHAASHNRAKGPAFWERFLDWTLTRFISTYSDNLNEQAILPTSDNYLSKPSSRVFFSPVSTPGRVTVDEERPHTIDDAGDELAAIDENVTLLLKFFDESAIKVRTGIARDYTPLAQKLAPIQGGGLVRRPRQADLINDALIPTLVAQRADNDKALSLLRQALVWLVAMPQKSRQRVSTDELLVPVCGQNDSWVWVEPENTYLGEGWLDDPNIDLLTTAFGNRPNSQLVPWDRFEKKVLQLFASADRSWWLQLMKEIGVWDCPRVIRNERRLEVMKAYSYSHLWVVGGVRCPISCADSGWSKYLSDISQRKAQTKSGQEFYLKDVTWIDGLEIEAIRHVVVEAMLRRPERYKPYQSTTLSRWGGEDSSIVPSLWVHAIRSENWSVIPTSHGLRKLTNAWFLPLESRSTKADRFEFLPCVRVEFSIARELLNIFGVVTIDEASISRLVNALHELAEQTTQVEPEALRHFNALVHDLYEAIQTKLKAQASSDALKRLLDHPVPLLQGEKIACVDLKEVERLYIDDDLVRRRFIDGFEECWIIPKRSHQSYNELIQYLREILGEGKVLRVSECAISIQFTPLEQGMLLLDYLRHNYPGRLIAEEIALLIVKGGNQATSPHEEMFRQTWSRIVRTHIVRGTFDAGTQYSSCFDAQHADGPALMVASCLQPYEIVGEMWQSVGPSYRDIWAAYALALKDGKTEAFFSDRGVSTVERTEVEIAIGLSFEQLIRRYQPVCLALWRRRNASRPIDDFHSEWSKRTRAVESARIWLEWDNVQAAIELAAHLDEPAGSISLLNELQVSIRAWQQARSELGAQPFRFVLTEQRYRSAQRAIAGHLMAWFAYLVVPRASGAHGPTVEPDLADTAIKWIKQIGELTVPNEVAEEPLAADIVIGRVAADVLHLADAIPAMRELSVFIEPLRDLSEFPPTEITSIKLKDEPDKAATIYEVNDEETRWPQAVAAVDSVLKIAAALAIKYSDTLDVSAEQKQPLVALLSHGPWANRVSVLAAVRYALEMSVPKIATRMKDRQAFRDMDDWRTLWKKFEELGELPKPEASASSKPKFTILGSIWTEEDFNTSAAQGPCGALVQSLQECVDPDLDLAALRPLEREKLPIRVKKTRPGCGGSGSHKRAPEAYLRMLGALGEHFVFQQMKVLFADFDLTNWRSKAKELFQYGEGDDSLGYDFEYHDMGGILTGNASVPRCLLEVKSTAQDGNGTFEMSTNEWETAIRCHSGNENAIYVIIRVINTASQPKIMDILVDPVQLHLDGVLDYSNRDLLVSVGKAQQLSQYPIL
ncbi:MAG: DUF3883 domain-containing protein [Syntrophaceae bacterium]|nr:DUF3883 domain-containing protein [Syntrophaceae bacterium]